MLFQLKPARKYLISVTGFDACSLQPTSGASGEYAGLLVIKKYLEDQGQGNEMNLCSAMLGQADC